MKKKRILLFIFILVFIDQIAKLIVANFFMNSQAVLIDGVLSFYPYLNTGLSYFISGINIPPIITTMLGGFSLGVYAFFGIYFAYLMGDRKALILYHVFVSFSVAMFICRTIDVVCWGGSLDFIEFNGIIYDIKDIYSLSMISFYILFILFIIRIIKRRIRLSKDERKEKGFVSWIKKGCPLFEQT